MCVLTVFRLSEYCIARSIRVIIIIIIIIKKVKQSRYRPEVAQRVPGS